MPADLSKGLDGLGIKCERVKNSHNGQYQYQFGYEDMTKLMNLLKKQKKAALWAIHNTTGKKTPNYVDEVINSALIVK